MTLVYKICDAAEWHTAAAGGRYRGSADDLRDGFIHLSTADQLTSTLERHFQGRTGLVLVAFHADALGPNLRWEPSRGGALFPHVYGDVLCTSAIAVEPIGVDSRGRHVVPLGSADGGQSR
jgi:uncharacterized protein (DUF952 family)